MLLKITLYTYDFRQFVYFEQILKTLTLKKLFKNIDYKKITLQPKTKHFTVLKSPHVHKKSQEHFQYKLYKQIFIINSTKLITLLYLNYIIFKNLNNNIIINSQFKIKKCL